VPPKRASNTLLRAQDEEESEVDIEEGEGIDESIEEEYEEEYVVNIPEINGVVVGEASLVVLAFLATQITGTPNYGFGPGISFDLSAIREGFLSVLPMFLFACVLEVIEKYVPALQDVSKAAQRSSLVMFGETFKPGIIFLLSLSMSLSAGIGEELWFRGVMQYELVEKYGSMVGLGVTSVIFGLLHAVTPLYLASASLASTYFGWLYLSTKNLVVPIVAHTVYDVCAFMHGHWTTTTKLNKAERDAVLNWVAPYESKDA